MSKVVPQLNQDSTREFNLTVLQRIDAHIEEILSTAAHVTFYQFNLDRSEWSRKDVEGSLFVVKRKTQPRFQFIVMNRRSTENLVEDLLSDFEYEVQLPYLLYRNGAQEVNGIWFYNQRDCEDVANLFSRILTAYKVSTKTQTFPSKSNEYQELEAIPTAETIEGPLEPNASTSLSLSESLPEQWDRFFPNSLNLGSSEQSSVENHLSAPHHLASSWTSSWTSSVASPMLAPIRVLSPASSSSKVPFGPLQSLLVPSETHDFPNPSRTTLLKPSFFVQPVPPTSTTPLPPPFVPSSAAPLQPLIGAPLLQPFPPPVPSPSLTPSFASTPDPLISRDHVREALHRLVQNDHFIDLVFREVAMSKFRDT